MQALAGKTVMSGIQPTGILHLGNLLGAISMWTKLEREAPRSTRVIFMIADLHAVTVPKAPEVLRSSLHRALAGVIACGVDPEKSALYFQSHLAAHSQLHWLLSCVSSMGYLNRMTQWKSKSNLDPSASILNNTVFGETNLGLFSYPTLQAADILIHQTDLVPVGEDQAQHLEFARHLAQSFNHRFGHTFTSPETILTDCKRVYSLRDASKKMSKSDPDQNSCIYITDSADAISKKIKRAVTDSIQGPITFDPVNRPEVANLVQIGAACSGTEPSVFLEKYRPLNHQQLKEVIAQSIIECIIPIGTEYQRLLADPAYLDHIDRRGLDRVRERAVATYNKAACAMGLK